MGRVSQFSIAFAFLMTNEDPLMACEIKPDAPGKWDNTVSPRVWNGAHVISGINSAAFPTQFAAIAAVPQEERLPEVMSFYQTIFWNKWYSEIVSDEVAKRVFDSAVNQGPATGVKIVQNAVNSLGGAQIESDGGWGPVTVAAVNNQNSAMLVNAFKAQRLAKYQETVDKNPALAHYLGTAENPGPWWIRAMK